MKIKEARALEREYNETVERGRKLWEEITPMAGRCNEILKTLRDAKVEFSEIALIFGLELQIYVAGQEDDEAGMPRGD